MTLVTTLGEINVSPKKKGQRRPFPWVIVSGIVLTLLVENEEGSARWKLFTVQLAEK